MTTLQFADTHNLVAFLSKPTESEGFEQIVNFLNANPIKYALTINPTIYTSCIEQFWATVKIQKNRRWIGCLEWSATYAANSLDRIAGSRVTSYKTLSNGKLNEPVLWNLVQKMSESFDEEGLDEDGCMTKQGRIADIAAECRNYISLSYFDAVLHNMFGV
ncbi:hypothetical protein Tco_0746426 [Tanacetum coccineum]